MRSKKIVIDYDGSYPNLCSGTLIVYIDGKRWDFPDYCLRSGGGLNEDYDPYIGDWSLSAFPEGFPEILKEEVVEAINSEIPYGCCGGCS
jgi:hypothetical protein